MTNYTEWIDKIKALEYPHQSITLLLDGEHRINLSSIIHKRKLVIEWYYNGAWEVKYCRIDSEIGKLIGCPMYTQMSKKMYDFYQKQYGKKHTEKLKSEYNNEVLSYNWYWSVPSKLIKHLKTNFKTIEVISSFQSLPSIIGDFKEPDLPF